LAIDRLTPHDIQQRPGGFIAVIMLAVMGGFFIGLQCISIWKTGKLLKYLRWFVDHSSFFFASVVNNLAKVSYRHHGCGNFVIRPQRTIQVRMNSLLHEIKPNSLSQDFTTTLPVSSLPLELLRKLECQLYFKLSY
jgi:hypothetical protein